VIFYSLELNGGVARIPCAWGQNYFALLSTKTAAFEVRNRRKSSKEAKVGTFAVTTFVLFRQQF